MYYTYSFPKRIYGQRDPPLFRLDVVTAPVAVYYSKQDWLADPQVRASGT